MTKEEYKENIIRYFNSLRGNRKSVMIFCDDVVCSECMFNELCHDFERPGMQPYQMFKTSFEVIGLLEKWVKDHPAITNKEKMEEVFCAKVDTKWCPPIVETCYNLDCNECRKWWNKEYKEPNVEEGER